MQSETQQGHTYKQWTLAVFANLAVCSYGIQCGWISTSQSVLQSDRSPTGSPLTHEDISWLASSLSLAAVVAVPVNACLVDRYGRKACIILIGVMQVMSWVLIIWSTNIACLIAGRVFAGFGAGASFNIVPMYVKEVTQANIRGTLGIILSVLQFSGLLAIYIIGGWVDYYTTLWIVAALPVVFVLAMIFAPESPTYLVKIGKVQEAKSVLASLRGCDVNHKMIQNEIDIINAEDEHFKSIPNVTFIGIFKVPAWRKGVVILIIILVVRGLSGVLSIMHYATSILQRSGVQLSPEVQSLSVPIFMIIGSLVTMTTVERFGRRMILVIALFLSVVSMGGIFVILLLQEYQVAVSGWLMIGSAMLAVFTYALGLGPIPFVIMAEMFNFQIRAAVMGVLVTVGWVGSFVQLLSYGVITEAFGLHTSFLCFTMINLFGFLVVLIFLPETKNKTVDQIEQELDKTLRK